MNHPGTICKQCSHQASQRFYCTPLTSTAISYLCLRELHQVGLSECVKCLYSPFSLSVFAGTDCSTHQSIRDQHLPDFLSTTSISQLSALGESLGGQSFYPLLSSISGAKQHPNPWLWCRAPPWLALLHLLTCPGVPHSSSIPSCFSSDLNPSPWQRIQTCQEGSPPCTSSPPAPSLGFLCKSAQLSLLGNWDTNYWELPQT